MQVRQQHSQGEVMMKMGIPPETAEMADRLAIIDVLLLHSRSLDRLDGSALQSCYWPEAEVDYGSYKGPAHPFASLVVDALGSAYELTRHSISNTLVSLNGTSARCESYVNADHLLPGGGQEMSFAGRYLDLLEKRDGQWRMLHRQVVMDWSRTRDIEDERNSEAFLPLAKGSHDAQDPLHAFLSAGGES
ncbi:MAG: nuclear transport factor 2 family protein [Halioglobus sp.]